jgi:hypothetical protein
MKRRLSVCCLCVLLLTGLCTGCNYVKAAHGADKSQTKADEASVREETQNVSSSSVLVPVGSNPVEKLMLSDSRLSSLSDLQIIKFDRGTFYGLGFGMNNGDCCTDSLYRFDFNGCHTAQISGGSCIYSEAREFPVGSGIFYYLQANEMPEGVRFMRLDSAAFQVELLLDDSSIAFDNIAAFCPGSHAAYYLDRRDNMICQLRYSDSRVSEVIRCPVDASLVNEIHYIGNELYVLEYDSCVKLNPSTGEAETAASGQILGSSEKEIYYLNDKSILCVYSAETGRSTETGVFTTLTKPYVMGQWTAFLSNPGKVVYVWDAEQGQIVMQASHKKIKHMAGACGGRYFLYTDSADMLGILDIKEQADWLIDVSCFAETAGSPIDRWYFDGQYLYAQDISEPSTIVTSGTATGEASEEAAGDAFYRLNTSRLTSAAIGVESII